jgi:hypothetical protein
MPSVFFQVVENIYVLRTVGAEAASRNLLQRDFCSACIWWFNFRVAGYTCPGVFHSICSNRWKLGGERRVG